MRRERRLDPEIAAALSGAAAPAQLLALDIPAIRELLASPPGPPANDARVHFADTEVPGPPGAPDVPARVYRPTEPGPRPGPGPAPAPALVYFHGGAFYLGDLESEHRTCLAATAETGCVTVSVGYRRAPEHPFPDPVDDCFAALAWVAGNADDLGIDATRLAVGGSSAGGCLAAAVALMARDRGGPALCYQLLLYPALDDRGVTASAAFDDVPVFDAAGVARMWRAYLGDTARAADVSPYAAPARADDLAGLPAAYVATAEHDPLRDEGIDYARRLLHAGVSVELHQFAGTVHGFDVMAPGAEISRRARADRLAALAAALRPR